MSSFHVEPSFTIHSNSRGAYALALPEVIPLAQYQVRLRVERRAHLSQSAVAASALQAVLVPEEVQSLQQEPLGYPLSATGALPRPRRAAVGRRRDGDRRRSRHRHPRPAASLLPAGL